MENTVNNLGPAGHRFAILSREDGSYIQIGGASLRLMMEYREVDATGGFRHFVLGKPATLFKEVSITMPGGVIRLKSNELLTRTQALEVFTAFWNAQPIPDSYTLRETTDSFRP